MKRTPEAPLIPGDTVEIVKGEYRGWHAAVGHTDPAARECTVYFPTTQQALPVPFRNLRYEGRPVADHVVFPDQLPDPPPESDLLRAVAAAGRDDTVRLVYADWLEEHGDPDHAEYLRAQVRLAGAVASGASFDKLVDRERRLRATLNPAWIARVRRLTTEPRPFDVAALDPDLAPLARESIRLHPRRGEVPEPDASKIGGLFLWPAAEPWPVKADFRMGEDGYEPHPPADGATVPLAPILQLHRRDVPPLPFPNGTDLLQLFWCPFWADTDGPEPFIFWRNSREVTRPKTEPPVIEHAGSGMLPHPCRLYPEVITEYPDSIDVPHNQDVRAAVDEWVQITMPEAARNYPNYWSHCHGCKVLGYPWSNQGHHHGVYHETADRRTMAFLLSLSLWELHPCHYLWAPIEDRNLALAGASARQTHDLTGGFVAFSRGNYSLAIDWQNPTAVKPYYDHTS